MRLNSNLRTVVERIKEYTGRAPSDIFDNPEHSCTELSRSAMGVPRTIGIALKQAFYRCLQSNRSKIRISDIEYGIKYATKAYIDQFVGAAGVALPSFYEDIWNALLDRAIEERSKVNLSASHFMVLPRNEEKLRYMNMFFLVHLITKGRTTKKEKLSRSLYAFDYGVCLENNLGYGTDKNTIRQQRFAYDEALTDFDLYFSKTTEKKFQCVACAATYKESELYVAGRLLNFCLNDRADLRELSIENLGTNFTEEEMKIIGAMRSSEEEDQLLARQVADDVGCYVQKVAKFGAKLERDHLIQRKMHEDKGGRNIYFKKTSTI